MTQHYAWDLGVANDAAGLATAMGHAGAAAVSAQEDRQPSIGGVESVPAGCVCVLDGRVRVAGAIPDKPSRGGAP
jgi:hypothetical protein